MTTSHLNPRRFAVVLSSAAACALVVGTSVATAVIPPPPDSWVHAVTPAGGHDADRLRLVATLAEFDSADVGKAGDSIGDLSAWSDVLSVKGRVVGSAGTSCTRTSTERGELNCIATLILDDRGTITLQGVVTDTGDYPLVVAVTGGTGEFASVGGTMTVNDTAGNPDKLRLSLRLTR